MRAELIVVQRLHAGIYRSSGGGERRVLRRFAPGPRGLTEATRYDQEAKAQAVRSFGNVGCGGTWIEVVQVGCEEGMSIDPEWYAPPAGASWEWWEQERNEVAREIARQREEESRT